MWTTKDVAELRALAALGASECARILGRSITSVRCAACRHRISLRRPGSRRGLILGQPRGVSLRRDLREDLVRDRRDELLQERARLDAEAGLCPCCGIRPTRVASSGFCLTCHRNHLADLHSELLSDDEAMRRLWVARQARKAALDALDATAAHQ
jgi:hypothetical protein